MTAAPPTAASLAELVDLVRELPYGEPSEGGVAAMLRERRGTGTTKHLFLATVLADRFPATQPRLLQRVYRLDRELAAALFGDAVAATVPTAGMTDVRCYLTALVGGERVVIDATFPGAEPWDGVSSLPLSCGPGSDHPAGPDPAAALRRLEAEHCDPSARDPFLAALAAASGGDPVRLQTHDPAWRERFEAERPGLEVALADLAVGGVHHVGATAVPAIPAEPVVDILVGTEGPACSRACLGPLAELGYIHVPADDEEAPWLLKPVDGRPVLHLYLAPAGSARYRADLTLRDLLAANLQAAIGFAGLKRDLARRCGGDRARYLSAKYELIRGALAWAESPQVA